MADGNTNIFLLLSVTTCNGRKGEAARRERLVTFRSKNKTEIVWPTDRGFKDRHYKNIL